MQNGTVRWRICSLQSKRSAVLVSSLFRACRLSERRDVKHVHTAFSFKCVSCDHRLTLGSELALVLSTMQTNG